MNRRVLKKFAPALVAVVVVGMIGMATVQSAYAGSIKPPGADPTFTNPVDRETTRQLVPTTAPPVTTPPAAPEEGPSPSTPTSGSTKARPPKPPLPMATDSPQVPCGECA
jgi:hypothetical protein